MHWGAVAVCAVCCFTGSKAATLCGCVYARIRHAILLNAQLTLKSANMLGAQGPQTKRNTKKATTEFEKNGSLRPNEMKLHNMFSPF